jgi:hypothetical protein
MNQAQNLPGLQAPTAFDALVQNFNECLRNFNRCVRTKQILLGGLEKIRLSLEQSGNISKASLHEIIRDTLKQIP